MKKKSIFVLTAVMMMSIVGCKGNVVDKENNTIVESSVESTTNMEESSSEDDLTEEESSVEETTVETEEETTTVAEQETTTKEQQTEKPVETTTKKPEETTTKKPEETTTKKPVEKPTEKPADAEAPIVKKVGSVDNTQYNKAVKAFESTVKKMRQDGIVKKTDICVTMEGKDIKVDINYADKDYDLLLKYNGNSKVYELVVDYEFCWLSELAIKINGKDSAPYNRELLKALLSMVSDEVETVFDRIDMDCFSANSLDTEKWSWSGDCFIKGGQFKVDQLFSYYLTKEKVEGRDKTCTLKGKNSSGKTVECVIDYNSKEVTFETVDNGVYMEGDDENFIYAYPTIKTGSNSYIAYKNLILDSLRAKGDPNAHVEEVAYYRTNGYSYYWLEAFYETADAKGDPEILYVQIGENEYIELYGFETYLSLEEFIDGAFFIREVNIK